jgi:hypothetical protein
MAMATDRIPLGENANGREQSESAAGFEDASERRAFRLMR